MFKYWFFIICFLGFPFFLRGDFQPNRLFLSGEMLYMAPSYDETYFVINGSGDDGEGNPIPSGKRNNNPVGYDFGFRLAWGMYDVCGSCLDFQFRWTHLCASNRINVANHDPNPQLWQTEIIPAQLNIPQPFSGEANSNIGIMFQKGECLLDEHLWNLNCWSFCIREGLEWTYIRYNESVTYVSDAPLSQTIKYHAHTKGMGPQLDVMAICEPSWVFGWCPKNLTFKFLTSASLIAANSKAKVKTRNTLGVQHHLTSSSFWKLMPEWHLGFEIDYLWCFRCFQTYFSFGYEATTYVRGTSKLVFTDTDHPGQSFTHYSDFYVHGLHFGLNIIY